jgi:shikimate 5-dehydrogenase
VAIESNLQADVHNPNSPSAIYDVVVIGAGPIGLATAIGLRKRGIENILVIDQTRAFRQVGQVLDLLPNGLKALKYLDTQAYEEVKETGNRLFNPKPPVMRRLSEQLKNQNPQRLQPNGFKKICGDSGFRQFLLASMIGLKNMGRVEYQ